MNKLIALLLAFVVLPLVLAIGGGAAVAQDSAPSGNSPSKQDSARPANAAGTGPQSGQSGAPNFPPATGSGINENKPGVDAGASHTTTDPKKAPLKIAVTQITQSADLPISTDGFQQELANQINFLGAKAVILGSDPSDRDASNEQAKRQGCDYVIFTNITGYRAAKVGERLGRVFNRGGLGGVGGSSSGRVEMSADVKVFQPDKTIPVLDGNNIFRGNDPDSTANGLMHTEARTVMLQIRALQKSPPSPNPQ
jgi:hypothetical protein